MSKFFKILGSDPTSQDFFHWFQWDLNKKCIWKKWATYVLLMLLQESVAVESWLPSVQGCKPAGGSIRRREIESLEKSRTSMGQWAGIWSGGSSVLPGDWCKPCFVCLFWSDFQRSLGRSVRERSFTVSLFFFYVNCSWLPDLLLLSLNAQNNYTFRQVLLFLSSLT